MKRLDADLTALVTGVTPSGSAECGETVERAEVAEASEYPKNSENSAVGPSDMRDRDGANAAPASHPCATHTRYNTKPNLEKTTVPGKRRTSPPGGGVRVQLAQIRVADRLRLALDEAKVATIAGSMAELGLQSPVLLRPWRAAGAEGSDAWGREDAGLFALVAGAHRLEAALWLGWAHIEALIVEGTPDEVRLIEIDENLARAELTVLDRARFLAARKRIHERMHPAQRRGGDRKSIDYAEENQSPKFGLRSFPEVAMERSSLSQSSLYRAVEIGKGLDDQAARDLTGTGLADREGDLHALSRMPASKQRVIAALCRASPRGATWAKPWRRSRAGESGRRRRGAGRLGALVSRRSSGPGAVPTTRRGGASSTGSREGGMADRSSVEWADAIWNPVTGCNNGMPHRAAPAFVVAFDGGRGSRDMVRKAQAACVPILFANTVFSHEGREDS